MSNKKHELPPGWTVKFDTADNGWRVLTAAGTYVGQGVFVSRLRAVNAAWADFGITRARYCILLNDELFHSHIQKARAVCPEFLTFKLSFRSRKTKEMPNGSVTVELHDGARCARSWTRGSLKEACTATVRAEKQRRKRL